jgi:hypothetical protein
MGNTDDIETRVRAKLQPYLLDGTEAVERILLMLQSSSRPSDLRRALASILRLAYRDTVPIDAAVEAVVQLREEGAL